MSSLREVQLCQLQILKAVAKVCEENNIDYMLACGSLLGAIRHKGYIPWDEDIDIYMTIENYRRFCKIGQKSLGDVFFVQNWRTEKEYPDLWTQVRMNGTTSMPVLYKKLNIHFGIHIDIFPIIGIAKDERKQVKRFEICRSLLASDFMKATDETPIGKQRIINRIPRVLRHLFCSLLEKKVMISPKNTEYSTEVWYTLYKKHRSELFYSFTNVDFEQSSFKTINEYDEYLTTEYGDYMTPPPESERGEHEIAFGQVIRDTKKDYREYLNNEQ